MNGVLKRTLVPLALHPRMRSEYGVYISPVCFTGLFGYRVDFRDPGIV